ncbi:MAG: hypothetical protein ACO3K7_01440 [Candidatus Marinamargulisbacteria bacterium]
MSECVNKAVSPDSSESRTDSRETHDGKSDSKSNSLRSKNPVHERYEIPLDSNFSSPCLIGNQYHSDSPILSHPKKHQKTDIKKQSSGKKQFKQLMKNLNNLCDQLNSFGKVATQGKHNLENYPKHFSEKSKKDKLYGQLNHFFYSDHMDQTVVAMGRMYHKIQSLRDPLLPTPDDLKTVMMYHEKYVVLFNKMISTNGFDCQPRDIKLWSWVSEGLKLAFPAPLSVENIIKKLGHNDVGIVQELFSKLYQDVMNPLVLFNAMLDDLADEIRSVGLVNIAVSLFRLVVVQDKDHCQRYKYALTSEIEVREFLNKELNNQELPLQEKGKVAFCEYLVYAWKIFNDAFSAFDEIINEARNIQRPSVDLKSDNSQSFRSILILAYKPLFKNFTNSVELNRNPSQNAIMVSKDTAYHNMNMVVFYSMAEMLSMTLSQKSPLEIIYLLENNMELKHIMNKYQRIGRYSNILATGIPTEKKLESSRELKNGDISGMPEILAMILNPECKKDVSAQNTTRLDIILDQFSENRTKSILNLCGLLHDVDSETLILNAFFDALDTLKGVTFNYSPEIITNNKPNEGENNSNTVLKDTRIAFKNIHLDPIWFNRLELSPMKKKANLESVYDSAIKLLLFHLMGRGDI